MDVVHRRFGEHDIDLTTNNHIVPNDDTTLFICSGMQNLKDRFIQQDGTKMGTLQSCIRTNDLSLIGDGSHLSFFQMLGNFSFGRNDYDESVLMWHDIVNDLEIPIDHISIHPSQDGHRKMWQSLGYKIVDDEDCVWSDGNIGGYCCEMFSQGLEIGNLVNTLEHSTDVGFGLERILQIVESKNRVDETSLFDTSLDPVLRDHVRTLKVCYENGIPPGNKRREYVVRRILRGCLRIEPELSGFCFDDWIKTEKELLTERLTTGHKMLRKHRDKGYEWWWDTCGLLPEEVDQLRCKS